MELTQLMTPSLHLALIVMMLCFDSGLQAPAQRAEDGSGSNSTFVTITPNDLGIPFTSCPGYNSGNPKERNKTGCHTGTYLKSVDHEKAFGFGSGSDPDWDTCSLPQLPQAK